MNKILQKIISEKEKEVLKLKNNSCLSELYKKINSDSYTLPKDKVFSKTLKSKNKNIIAEIKRKSPSNNHIATISNPIALASKYIEGGASAISILTDQKFFGGSLDDLINVKTAFNKNCHPLLRKDFTIDVFQILEAYDAGADCILLIVAALGKEKIEKLLGFATKLGLDSILEVHTKEELDIALKTGAQIIGINNRNLDTFEINLDISKSLIKEIPKNILKISESGIKSPDDAKELFKCGFDAILVGEILSSSDEPEKLIWEMIK